MFGKFRLHGAGDGAAVTWGYRTAVRLKTWRISKTAKSLRVGADGRPVLGDQVWTLNGTLADRPDAFVIRRTPLILAIPRHGGFWTWPIVGQITIQNNVVIASLGQPLQG